MWYTYTTEYHPAVERMNKGDVVYVHNGIPPSRRKNELFPFAAT